MSLKFTTHATPKGSDWWAWTVRLDEPSEVRERIREVEYVLHPTFRDRIQTMRNADDGFALHSEGWGEFDLVANVRFVDGAEQTVIVPLKLE